MGTGWTGTTIVYHETCANVQGAGATVCDLCGSSWCHECGPGKVHCARADGGDQECDKEICGRNLHSLPFKPFHP